MNIKEIKEIIELMKENNIDEFEMERDGLKIALKRSREGIIQPTVIHQMPQPAAEVKPEIKPEPAKENITHIVSPMVGTFYAAPSPDSPPFVVSGDEVAENDVVCIIEAMKVMNEIKAETKGSIKEILVKNGEPVEFGQPLFVVEKV